MEISLRRTSANISPTLLIVLSFFITMAFDFEDLLFQLEEAENGNEMLEAIDAYVEGVA